MLLNPLLLLGLFAVASPVLIHWLTKHPPRPLQWAAMRFLQEGVEKHRRRLRQEDLLLLLIRCAIVALLAIALARPAWRVLSGMIGGIVGGAGSDVYLVVDDSMSMRSGEGVRSRFELARESARTLLDRMPAGTRVALWTSSGPPGEAPVAAPSADRAAVREAIDALAVTDRGGRVQATLARLAGSATRDAQVVLLTDGQASDLEAIESLPALLAEGESRLTLATALVAGEARRNASVLALRPLDGAATVGRPVAVEATLANTGQVELANVRVWLEAILPGSAEPRRVDEAVVERLAPGGSSRVVLDAVAGEPGTLLLTAATDTDPQPGDDRSALALDVKAQRRVLMIEAAASGTPREGFFVEQALVPRAAPGTTPRYAITRSPAPRLTPTDFEGVDVVVWLDGRPLHESALPSLDRFVRDGGTLLVFAGASLDAAWFNTRLGETLKLLPVRFGSAGGELDDDAGAARLSGEFLSHPLASVWQESSLLGEVRVRRAWTMEPTDDARVVMRLVGTRPLVVEADVGRGAVYVVATSADTSWTDLPVRPGVFVPLLHRAIGAGLTRKLERVNTTVGQLVSIGQGTEARHLERDTAVARESDGFAPRFAGVYETVGVDPTRFAVTAPTSESTAGMMSQTQREVLTRLGSVTSVQEPGDIAQLIVGQSGRREWTPWLLAMLVALLLAESALAHRFSRPK